MAELAAAEDRHDDGADEADAGEQDEAGADPADGDDAANVAPAKKKRGVAKAECDMCLALCLRMCVRLWQSLNPRCSLSVYQGPVDLPKSNITAIMRCVLGGVCTVSDTHKHALAVLELSSPFKARDVGGALSIALADS